jgi:hypothetical protein
MLHKRAYGMNGGTRPRVLRKAQAARRVVLAGTPAAPGSTNPMFGML